MQTKIWLLRDQSKFFKKILVKFFKIFNKKKKINSELYVGDFINFINLKGHGHQFRILELTGYEKSTILILYFFSPKKYKTI